MERSVSMKKNLVLLKNVASVLCVCLTALIFSGCNWEQKQAQAKAELLSKFQVDVSGAKSIGGGGTDSSRRSVYGQVSSRSSKDELMSLVKFKADGKSESIFKSLPEYSNLEFRSVTNIIVSPDDSVYIIWDDGPYFNNYAPYSANDNYNPNYAEADKTVDTQIQIFTGRIWRITKDGELSWFDEYDFTHEGFPTFPWKDSYCAYEKSIDKNGNLYALETSQTSNAKILQYNPDTQKIKTISVCLSSHPKFEVCGDYIFEWGSGYIRVIPINDPDGYWYLARNTSDTASYSVNFYDYLNDVTTTNIGTFYSPFKTTNSVTVETPEQSTVKPFIRGNQLYARVYCDYYSWNETTYEDEHIETDKIYALNYSNHEYTLDDTKVIDVQEISSKLFDSYSRDLPEKRMNSSGYFYLDSDTADFFPHIMFVDGTTGAVQDLNTNLPSNIDIYDIAVNDTDVYFTGTRGTTPISGKINIATGEYTNSGSSVPIKVLATVDF